MRTLFAVAVVVSLAWVPAPARADAPVSLGEIAAREKNKKKGKPITEDDLRNRRRGGTVSQPSGAAGSTAATPASPAPGTAAEKAGAAGAAEKPPTEEEAFAAGQTAWREKLTAAQSEVTNWTGEVARLQAALNDNTVPMYGAGRQARVDAVENAKRQLAAATTTLESLQEEGRRSRYR
jgi:hypothetical protein